MGFGVIQLLYEEVKIDGDASAERIKEERNRSNTKEKRRKEVTLSQVNMHLPRVGFYGFFNLHI